MMPIDWPGGFQEVASRGTEALEWRLPEAWVHAELFAALNRRAEKTGWKPFSIELPYATFYPVVMPGPGHSDWKKVGAVKYTDLCIQNEAQAAWCWFEFKVRHAGTGEHRIRANKEARTAFCSDVVALLGLSPERTSALWANPDVNTKAYWMPEELSPHAAGLMRDDLYFTAAFMLLGGSLDPDFWERETLMRMVRQRLKARQSLSGYGIGAQPPPIVFSSHPLTGGHELLLCEWKSS